MRRFLFSKIINQKSRSTVLAAVFALLMMPLAGLGCISFQSSSGTGGVWKSPDRGETWEQKVLLSQQDGKAVTIARTNVIFMIADPVDSQTLYIGTQKNGMFVTYDGAESWRRLFFPDVPITDLAIDPKFNGNLYTFMGSQVFRSNDYGKNWSLSYRENRAGVGVTGIEVDAFDTRKIYASLSSGELLRSTDRGTSWSVVQRFDSSVLELIVDPFDTRHIYVGTALHGLYRTTDAGASWNQINAGFELYNGSFEFRELIANPGKRGHLIYASDYGLLQTRDGGTTWSPVELITPPGTAPISALAVNPNDDREIYYGTNSTFYKSTDGGGTWITKPLPPGQVAETLMVDRDDPRVVSLGVIKFVEEKIF